jgi:hypothetical protein
VKLEDGEQYRSIDVHRSEPEERLGNSPAERGIVADDSFQLAPPGRLRLGRQIGKLGASIFFTDYSMAPTELAVARLRLAVGGRAFAYPGDPPASPTRWVTRR